MYTGLSQVEMLSAALAVSIMLFIAFKIGSAIATKKSNRELLNIPTR